MPTGEIKGLDLFPGMKEQFMTAVTAGDGKYQRNYMPMTPEKQSTGLSGKPTVIYDASLPKTPLGR